MIGDNGRSWEIKQRLAPVVDEQHEAGEREALQQWQHLGSGGEAGVRRNMTIVLLMHLVESTGCGGGGVVVAEAVSRARHLPPEELGLVLFVQQLRRHHQRRRQC